MFKELKEASFLLEGELIDFSSIPSFSKPDFKIEIEYLLDLLAKRGLEAFFVETTHKDLNLPAVIVSIPGAKLNRPSARLHPYLLIARQLMDIGLYNDATIYLKEVLDIEPHYRQIPQIICQVAVCYKMAGRYLEARQHFEQALSLAPKLIHSSRFIADFMEVIQKEKT
jgi:ribosomal protein S12 methylthiotransferase accessory factor